MRQDQLEHAIRTASQIIVRHEVIVVGSQSILGTFREDQMPADATRSVEIDILPIADDNSETERLPDLIEGVAGEFSPFEELRGFSIDHQRVKATRGRVLVNRRRSPGPRSPRRRRSTDPAVRRCPEVPSAGRPGT